MQRRNFIQKSIFTAGTLAGAGLGVASAKAAPKNKEVYEFRVYAMRRNLKPLDNYFSNAFIPALNRMGVKNVGAFKETSMTEPAKVYMLIPYSSFEDFGRITMELKNDKEFAEARSDYDKIPLAQAIYDRYDSSLLLAFDGHPKMTVPPAHKNLFELRSYEGYSEDALRRKVRMFNEGEIEIFSQVKLPAVFYSENIAGKNLPCLTYMAAYENMEERDRVWKAFSAHPDWQRMSKLPEYADTVSRIHRTFLESLPYSQV